MKPSTDYWAWKTRWSVLLLGLLLVIPFAMACGDDDDDDGDTSTTGATEAGPTEAGEGDDFTVGEVNVLGIWGGEELESFDAMMEPWVDAGGTVNFTGTRSITSELTLRVEGGDPPDVAIPAEIGLFQEFAQNGDIISLDQCEGLEDLIRDKYPESFVDLGTVDGTLYGFFMKADTKGTIWYNPATFEEAGIEPPAEDASFDDLIALSQELLDAGVTPWSVGMEAGDGSGFPGSDWLQQIILNEAGEETYDGLIDGSVPFTDDAVRAAWEQWGEIVLNPDFTVQSGPEGINATNFQDAVYPPFQDPPDGAMVALGGFAGGFITTQFPDAEAGTDFDFFAWPGGQVTGAANIVYAFNNDPGTCGFLEYLASGDAQQIWVERGGFTSVNSDVGTDAYPDDVARKQAEQLLDAETFRFDLDDAIGGALQQALFRGVTEYLANPDSLDSILESIEGARGQATD